jgi:hypothetical protein
MKLKIDGRELEFPELDTMTFREAGIIKKVTGLRMGQYAQAFEDGDVDMVLALALVALKRADGIVDQDILLDTPISKIEVIPNEPEVEDNPDPPAPAAAEVAPDEATADVAPTSET